MYLLKLLQISGKHLIVENNYMNLNLYVSVNV